MTENDNKGEQITANIELLENYYSAGKQNAFDLFKV